MNNNNIVYLDARLSSDKLYMLNYMNKVSDKNILKFIIQHKRVDLLNFNIKNLLNDENYKKNN